MGNSSKTNELCPRCSMPLREFLINHKEKITMCPNLKCPYPLFPGDPLRIMDRSSTSPSVASSTECNTTLPKTIPQSDVVHLSQDAFDIEKFIEEMPAPNELDNIDDLPGIIEELLGATQGLPL